MAAENTKRRADAIRSLTLLFSILLLAHSVHALAITSPAGNITAATLPTSVTAAWSAGTGPYTVALTGQQPITTNATQHPYTLTAGTYTLTVQDQNATATRTFTVSAARPSLSIAADKTSYDVGDVVRLTATSNRQVTATLRLMRDGALEETYTLSIDGSVDLFYIPEQPGIYQAVLESQGATATTTWTALAQQPLSADFTHTDAIRNKKTVFTATATGGVAPYTYNWLFSDNTAGTGRENEHYFFTTGAHTATLIVTDAEGTQKSVEKSFTVTETRYTLDITVRSQQGDFLKDISVRVAQGNDEEIKKTNSAGTAVFNGLRGNYTINLTQASRSFLNRTINLSKDENLLLTIAYSTPAQDDENTTNTSNTSTVTQTPTPQQAQETVSTPQPTAAEIAAKALAEKKADAEEALEQRRFNLKLDPKKDRILTHLELYGLYDDAIDAVTAAVDEQAITSAKAQAPSGVTILDETSEVDYPDPDALQEQIATFIDAKGVSDEKLAKKYARNIKELAKNISVRTTTTKARIDYGETHETWTLVTRVVSGSENAYAVEIVPKTFAADVSDLKLEGDYDVLESDPVIRFTSDTYTFAARTQAQAAALPLIVPETLQDYGVLSGLISITLGESDSGRSLVYLLLIGIVAAGVIVGRKVGARTGSGVFDEFSELAEQALDMINNGEGEKAVVIAPDLDAIYQQLPTEQQAALADVMSHIKDHATTQQFLSMISEAHTTVSQNADDVNTVTQAYEHAIGAYEELPERLREELKEHITRLHDHLDKTLQL